MYIVSSSSPFRNARRRPPATRHDPAAQTAQSSRELRPSPSPSVAYLPFVPPDSQLPLFDPASPPPPPASHQTRRQPSPLPVCYIVMESSRNSNRVEEDDIDMNDDMDDDGLEDIPIGEDGEAIEVVYQRKGKEVHAQIIGKLTHLCGLKKVILRRRRARGSARHVEFRFMIVDF
ncbi:uncharacterized protein LOC131018182 [Salvia miltiorrhiza]|uniref:uncharacterized protein LOC131018182 n=1 Tax=Salvia miltiorrhiza TaxID=226208 RepID=UPI0025AC57C8|nr:uncharacterized protein LOC131018182 [Salvia miltiorrhiza]